MSDGKNGDANTVEQFVKQPVPPMTDPMGRSWNQPDISEIEFDDSHALMNKRTFEALSEYSCSQPSGVYPGKMWMRTMSDGSHFLCWFDVSEKGDNYCSTKLREILIV